MRSDRTADHSSQFAENQKRPELSPLELGPFIRAQVDAGDSNATIARQLGTNLTAVSHHLLLLDLPPVLDDALKAGRCTSPRTLHELSRLHDRHPVRVEELHDGSVPITRGAVNTLRARVDAISTDGTARLIGQAISACDRLEKLFAIITLRGIIGDLAALRSSLTALSLWSTDGSDRQTPCNRLARSVPGLLLCLGVGRVPDSFRTRPTSGSLSCRSRTALVAVLSQFLFTAWSGLMHPLVSLCSRYACWWSSATN
jgi:hypothetical protein